MRLRDGIGHAMTDEMVASDRRSWAGTRKHSTHLQSVTLDLGIPHPWEGLFTCTLVCMSEIDMTALAVRRVLSFLFLLHTNTRKSICIRYVLYYLSITATRRCNWADSILVSYLYYCPGTHLQCIHFLGLIFFIYYMHNERLLPYFFSIYELWLYKILLCRRNLRLPTSSFLSPFYNIP